MFFSLVLKKAALQKIVLELEKRNFHYFYLVQFFPPEHGPRMISCTYINHRVQCVTSAQILPLGMDFLMQLKPVEFVSP